MKKAVILFSGGLDSTTCLAIAKAQHYTCHALSIHYGQKHSIELEAAKKIASRFKVAEHKIMPLEVGVITGSALTDQEKLVPHYSDEQTIPSTYVPARNTIFFSLALGYAETIGASAIFTGITAIDYSNYPDCRPEYLQAFQTMANLATKSGIETQPIRFFAPLLYLSKAEAILEGLKLGVDYAMTISCYKANALGQACGTCHSCVLRSQGFKAAGVPDPTHYSLAQ